MPRTWTRQQAYQMPPAPLFACCMTALGHMRARIEAQDSERGTVVATIGSGRLAPITELALTLTPIDVERTMVAAVCRARAWGGDRRILPVFMELLDSLVYH